jgi:acyl dehydratase
MSNTLTHDAVKIGDELHALQLPPVDRSTLALFAGASGDHNPIHIDIDFARKAGMPDVFAHGMLGMAWLGRLVTNWAPQSQLRQFNARFQGITHLGHAVRCGSAKRQPVRTNQDRGRRADRTALTTTHSARDFQ